MEEINIKIDRFYGLIANYVEGGPDTRYKSWEWCHKAFMIKKDEYWATNDQTIQDRIVDYLALHLAFYLASWGMYRGSSFLLQRDYKAHKPAVRYMLEERYCLLWDYQPQEKNINEATNLLFSEDEAELGIYHKIKDSYNLIEDDSDTPTDTLITKILMGTYGCVPAYDRFLKSGIAAHTNCYGRYINGIRLTQSINRNTFQALAHLAINHSNEFVNNAVDFYYPPMKCIDMYFWEIGYEIDIASGLINNANGDEKKNALLNLAVELRLCNEGLTYEDAHSEIMIKNQ